MSEDINPLPLCLHDMGRDNFNFTNEHQGNERRKIGALFGIYTKG